jgi:molybdopterin molybdotransferase
MVTAHLFLKPLIDAMTGAMTGATRHPAETQRARTAALLPASGTREEYLRAVLTIDGSGVAHVKAAENQDSSLLSPFLTANALIRRPVHSPAAAKGDLVEVVNLG